MPIIFKKAIDVTRSENMRLLEIEYGTKEKLAKSLCMPLKSIYQFLKKKNPVPLDAVLARKMEKQLGKPKGWMDRKNCKLALSSDEWLLVDSYREGTDRDRVIVTTLANMLATQLNEK